MGKIQIKAKCFALIFFFNQSIRAAIEIWNMLAGVVKANKICVKYENFTVFILGAINVQHNNNTCTVVNKNHKEYGLASTQYIHTMGETKVTHNAYKAANME